MSCEIKFNKKLRELGYRITPQRRAILHILLHANMHLTPTEVYKQARKNLRAIFWRIHALFPHPPSHP